MKLETIGIAFLCIHLYNLGWRSAHKELLILWLNISECDAEKLCLCLDKIDRFLKEAKNDG